MEKTMDIEFEQFDKITDRLVTLYYYFFWFLVGMAIAMYLVKQEIKSKRNEQLNRIFFGAAKKEDS